MRYLYHLVRKYPLTVSLLTVVWYLSFFTPPHTPLDNVTMMDKWVHIAMYGGTCAVMWFEYLKKHRTVGGKARLIALTWAAPIIMSGVIELLQEYCTNGRRSGDWLDLAANATGVTLAAVIGLLLAHRRTTS